LYRTICREWTFYSHPAIVDVDLSIRHFPEHRKVALLADEPPPGFNAFTIGPATYALGLFIASAVFDGGPGAQEVGYSCVPGQCPADPVAQPFHYRAACEGYGPPASAGGEAGQHTVSSGTPRLRSRADSRRSWASWPALARVYKRASRRPNPDTRKGRAAGAAVETAALP
jgi:hypothetical protein